MRLKRRIFCAIFALVLIIFSMAFYIIPAQAGVGIAADAGDNTVSINPNTVTAGDTATITATGDNQDIIPNNLDERYIPTDWTSSEAGKSGVFALVGGDYTSDYTPASAGNHTVTVTFQKQQYSDLDGWCDVFGETDTKTAVLTVNSPAAVEHIPAYTSSEINGRVIDARNGMKVSDIPAVVDNFRNGNITLCMNIVQAIVVRQLDGNIVPFGITSLISISGPQSVSVTVSFSERTILVSGLEKGKNYILSVNYDLGSGKNTTIGTIEIIVDDEGKVDFTSTLIDPYGKITDADTEKPIEGAVVTLCYADTERNRAAGMVPDTIVSLPYVASLRLNNNVNPQASDVRGAYGFIAFPSSDYYITAVKEGYDRYVSPLISAEQGICRFDFQMHQAKFQITRLGGADRIDTSLIIAEAGNGDRVSNVLLATADNYPDALTGSVLAYRLNAPILLVGNTDADQEKVLNYLKTNLDPSGNVYILGGTAVVSTTMENKIKDSGFRSIIRLAGTDRYGTSVKIAENLSVKAGTPIVLVSGEDYPDALSISSIAAQMQYPILLSHNDEIDKITCMEIAAINPGKVYIIGEEGAVGKNIEKQISQLTGLGMDDIIRIGDIDRYATSVSVAQYFNLSGEDICIATGDSFPDALSGSVYAANHKAPVILIGNSLSDEVINYLKGKRPARVILFGGDAVVSKYVEQQIKLLADN